MWLLIVKSVVLLVALWWTIQYLTTATLKFVAFNAAAIKNTNYKFSITYQDMFLTALPWAMFYFLNQI